MNRVLAEVPINQSEVSFIELFRVAVSEPEHLSRLRAIHLVRHDITAQRLGELFGSPAYICHRGLHDFGFLQWAAETAIVRHEAFAQLADLDKRFQDTNQRRLNIAEYIGSEIFHSIQDGKFQGVQTPDGILAQVGNEAKDASVAGGRDKDTLRKIWKTYRGVVHLGMAITYLEDNPDQSWDVLELAEMFREKLSTNCPRGTKRPYVAASVQIKFVFISMLKGPRFRNRGLPFFEG